MGAAYIPSDLSKFSFWLDRFLKSQKLSILEFSNRLRKSLGLPPEHMVKLLKCSNRMLRRVNAPWMALMSVQ